MYDSVNYSTCSDTDLKSNQKYVDSDLSTFPYARLLQVLIVIFGFEFDHQCIDLDHEVVHDDPLEAIEHGIWYDVVSVFVWNELWSISTGEEIGQRVKDGEQQEIYEEGCQYNLDGGFNIADDPNFADNVVKDYCVNEKVT